MPTARKNSPSRMPRNGSMSASSWCRKVEVESSTPARNAPIAMLSPPNCMSSAAPSTTSSAAAVITSRARALARTRNTGLRIPRPTARGQHATERRRMAIQAGLTPARRPAARRQHRDHGEQRHDHQILEQKDRDDLLPARGRELSALLKDLHDDGGRGQNEPHAGDERHRWRAPKACRSRSAPRRRAPT